jgi:hypothetical protein
MKSMLLLIVILSLIVVQLKGVHELLTIFMFGIQMSFHTQ